MKLRLAIACACVAAQPAAAENRAFLMEMSTEGEDAELAAAGDLSNAAEALEAAGFEVVSGMDMEIDALRADLESLMTEEAPERSVILLTGRFATSGSSSWYLPGEADETDEAEAPSLATVDGEALSLGTVLEIAGRSPGGAVVLLGAEAGPVEDTDAAPEAPEAPDADAPDALGTGLVQGLGMIEPPQGVTVISGEIADIVRFAEETLVTPGLSLPAMLEDAEELEAHGFLSPLLPFLPEDDAAPEPEAAPDEPSPEEEAAAAEREVWQATQDTDTIVAYEAYLTRYPDGAFADEARAAIDALADDPERMEAALGLGAAERRQVQQDLTTLDHDPRGVDGVFGPGSRGAISNWQQANGFEPTGFVNAEQIAVLGEMAATRRAELEEEEREEALARERADRAHWEDTGRGQDEAGLRAYLDRFPDGLFSDVATARLTEIDAARDREAWERAQAEGTEAAYRGYLEAHEQGAFADRARARLAELGEADARAADEAAWDAAQQADTAGAYAEYLEAFPEGAFSEPAAGRLAELTETAPDDPAMSEDEAREAEAALGLGMLARSLVETQLQAQGFSPGRIDGQFDGNTRGALRGYQEARGLPVTGYVDRETLNRMIADGLPLPR